MLVRSLGFRGEKYEGFFPGLGISGFLLEKAITVAGSGFRGER